MNVFKSLLPTTLEDYVLILITSWLLLERVRLPRGDRIFPQDAIDVVIVHCCMVSASLKFHNLARIMLLTCPKVSFWYAADTLAWHQFAPELPAATDFWSRSIYTLALILLRCGCFWLWFSQHTIIPPTGPKSGIFYLMASNLLLALLAIYRNSVPAYIMPLLIPVDICVRVYQDTYILLLVFIIAADGHALRKEHIHVPRVIVGAALINLVSVGVRKTFDRAHGQLAWREPSEITLSATGPFMALGMYVVIYHLFKNRQIPTGGTDSGWRMYELSDILRSSIVPLTGLVLLGLMGHSLGYTN